MSRLTEDELIAQLFAPMAGEGGLGLRDDAALLRPKPGWDQVITIDALVAGIHFFADDPPGAIAAKALGVNLSDLAAKGAEPSGFVLALALPPDWTADWLDAFAKGLADAAADAGCPLLGGDTVKTPGPLTLSITAFGAVPAGRMVQRTGARAGDRLYVSGTIGDAALGLQLRIKRDRYALDPAPKAFLLARYLEPQPRLALAPVLRAFASGAMDVSDGLIGDALKMLRASGVSGTIDLGRVPLSVAARAALASDADALTTIVTGGDDYEILASVASADASAFEHAAAQAGIAVTHIGDVVEGAEPLQVRDAEGRPIAFEAGSFSHF